MATTTGMVSGSGSYNFKVVLLGEGCVGKTSVVLRYVEDKFNEKHISTLQVSFIYYYQFRL
jgi:Ras-related protein Rab-21